MKKRKVAVLTYTVKHRKTFDLLSLLKGNGYEDVIVYATPFHYIKKKFPIYQHRPEMNYKIPEIEELCKNFGYICEVGQFNSFSIEQERVILIAGAGILPEDFVKSHTVINAHPGYIPECRGLDALKWAVVGNKPIGVTTHLIGEFVDAGMIIERRRIEINSSDTFHALAQRVYENEISMLVEAIEKCDKCNLTFIAPGDNKLYKRMPEKIEKELLNKFEQYKIRHIKNN